jgi:sugar phosphate isomerase/epimerase
MYSAIFGRTYPLTNSSDVLAAAAADGFCGVQFNLLSAGLASLPEELPEGVAEQVRDAAQSRKIRLAALSGTYNMAHPDPNARAASREGFRNVVKAAQRMGSPIVTLCTGSRDPHDMWKRHPDNQSVVAWSVFRGELDFALGLAETAGIRLGVEPEPGNVVNDADAARRLLDEVASPLLGIVLDAANLLSSETLTEQHEVIERAAQLLGDSLLLAHAKDIDFFGHVAAAGEGAVDLAWFVTALRGVGYDGALIGHGFPAEKAAHVSKILAGLIGRAA